MTQLHTATHPHEADAAALRAREALLPEVRALRVLGTEQAAGADPDLLLSFHRRLVTGRRFNEQVTTLTRQGMLAGYPSSTGQEACQIAAAQVLRPQDWLFPTYRDALAVVARDIDPLQVLGLMRGDWHNGYDPRETRTAPLCTPLATHLPHAAGLAHAARLAGDDVVALALTGDGGTSEGDFHEGLNFAAVQRAPVVFLVQNNGYAISVPLHKQSAAPSLAHKGVGYGMPSTLVDGNDVLAVHTALGAAVERARGGGGPTLVEALTYRIDAHTNADDSTRYRPDSEVERWRRRDPVLLLERELQERGLLDEAVREKAEAEADALAAMLRRRLGAPAGLDPMDLFEHVFAEPTSQLLEQRDMLSEELRLDASQGPAGGAHR
ncbi:thiamine pyrophosphate-dependent dehydrogenase E1 component subunit alpha [Streptomyces sp. NBC_00654]|uniref:thiamine pyrophosphate-dependent dehydrogenase E1 component subunit alpha n=1 Tax=Streptomyces sp. NBC_00654 TaxID=2975799 RepID=UPI002253B627|nr:thiamine pyrophosphate-dependent dehydrogenase E1 component subunit alpha [Streptomyces sp. NBC_00654]MCX4966055.1 thiamine pyrophosphate-dependent dehydrogenase E1 component subunit alpha [Streptomyces sp. NBC_00654]